MKLTPTDARTPGRGSLWVLTIAPTIWAAHLLLCYATAAIWCAKVVTSGGPLDGIRNAIMWYTAVALVGIAITGWEGFRAHSYPSAPLGPPTPLGAGPATPLGAGPSAPLGPPTPLGAGPSAPLGPPTPLGAGPATPLGAGPATPLGAGTEATTHDLDTAEDRHRFLGFATLLLSGLSAVAVLYAALAASYFESCR